MASSHRLPAHPAQRAGLVSAVQAEGAPAPAALPLLLPPLSLPLSLLSALLLPSVLSSSSRRWPKMEFARPATTPV